MELENRDVAAVIEGYPEDVQAGIVALRACILAVADSHGIELKEALRWGQPAYLAAKGSTLRLGVPKTGGYALYAHCQTSLISDFKALHPELHFEGNRAVHFGAKETPPVAIDMLIYAALTYHQR